MIQQCRYIENNETILRIKAHHQSSDTIFQLIPIDDAANDSERERERDARLPSSTHAMYNISNRSSNTNVSKNKTQAFCVSMCSIHIWNVIERLVFSLFLSVSLKSMRMRQNCNFAIQAKMTKAFAE